MKAFLKRKKIDISWQSYGIKAMSAMAQGLFCTLLVGTIGAVTMKMTSKTSITSI